MLLKSPGYQFDKDELPKDLEDKTDLFEAIVKGDNSIRVHLYKFLKERQATLLGKKAIAEVVFNTRDLQLDLSDPAGN